MTGRRTWSLIPLSTLIVGTALSLLVMVGSLFAFNSYVASLNRDSQVLLTEALSELHTDPNNGDAARAGTQIATRLFPSTLIVVFIGTTHRVTVFRRTKSVVAQPAVVAIRERDDRSAEPAAGGGFGRFVLGVASICGLQIERGHYHDLDIYVKSNDRALVANVGSYVLPFTIAVALAFAASAAIARILTIQGLRPLLDVTAALERFAEGDFTPQFVATSAQAELGTLARAYNGAVAQVERAFGERERVDAMMRQFIADAGHQLRTPLTVIRGFVTILADPDGTPSDERQRILRITNQQIVLMRVLIDNLMLLDRWEDDRSAATFELIDVTQLVDDIVTMTRDANSLRDVTLRATETAFAHADPRELTYAITNILDNAIKYTAGTIEAAIEVDATTVRLAISDEGPGMSSDVAQHAFDRFFRGERRDVHGSGLGLAIAKKAVERAGGSIELSTDARRGSSIQIELPRALDIGASTS